jgi:hypothetical protein
MLKAIDLTDIYYHSFPNYVFKKNILDNKMKQLKKQNRKLVLRTHKTCPES